MVIKTSSVVPQLLLKKFDTYSKLLELPKYIERQMIGSIWLVFCVPQGQEQEAKLFDSCAK